MTLPATFSEDRLGASAVAASVPTFSIRARGRATLRWLFTRERRIGAQKEVCECITIEWVFLSLLDG